MGAVLALGRLPEGDFALITALHALSVMSFMCSWNALNDYLDLEIDLINRPDRPLPSDTISKSSAKRAIVLMSVLSVLSIAGAGVIASGLEEGIEGWYPAPVIWAGALLLLMNYESTSPISFRLKERGLPGNFAISLSVGMVVLFGAAGVYQPFHPRAWTVFLVGFLYNLAREIVKDVEDIAGDRAMGAHTLAIDLGARRAAGLAAVVYLLLVAATVVPWSHGLYGWGYLVPVAILDLLVVAVMARLLRSPEPEGHELSRTLTGGMALGLLAIVLGEFQ